MSKPEATFQEYLAVKRTVDDRALNRRVLDRLAAEIEGESNLRVLNVGAGIGTALERFLDVGILPDGATYTLVDVRETTIETARERLPRWADREGHDSVWTGDELRIETPETSTTVEFVVADAFEFVNTGAWDLVVGQAFLDLFDARAAFESLVGALDPGGWFYFPITFDGGTIFEPVVDPALDRRIERLYHADIDDGGDSHAGRHLLVQAGEVGDVLAVGSSDWVVHPTTDGYRADEGAFLEYIVDTVAEALDGVEKIDADARREWAATRHRQITREKLVYVAHQLDVLGRVSGEGHCDPA